jgi:RNA polymerase sigma factor (sigma-70 family)
MTALNFAYIPDPGKRQIHVGYSASLDARVRAQHKPLSPLMTVVAVDEASAYLSQKHGKEVVLNGEGEALLVYQHQERQYYRRSDLDALVFENHHAPQKPRESTTGEERDAFDLFMSLPVDDAPERSTVREQYARETDMRADVTTPKILPVHETMYVSFRERYGEITVGRKEGLQRVIRAWDALSLLEQTTLTWAYVEKKGAKDLQEALVITKDEYRKARRNAEDIMLNALEKNEVPIREYKATSSSRPTAEKRPEGCELLLRYYNIALDDEKQQKMDVALSALDPKERYAVLTYYGYRVQMVHIAREMELPVTEVRPLIESGFAKVRAVLEETYKPAVAEEAEEIRRVTPKPERTRPDGLLEDEVKDVSVAEPSGEIPQTKQTEKRAPVYDDHRSVEDETKVRKKPTAGNPIAQHKRRADLLNRMEAYRMQHGTKELFTREDDLDSEKYMGTLGKKAATLEVDGTADVHAVSLEERCQSKHKEVQAFLRKMRRRPDLSSRKDVYDLTAVIIGDSTIDFLINSPAYPVAARYAELLYERAKASRGVASPRSKGYSLWPLVTAETYNPHRKSKGIDVADHTPHFIQCYEAYAVGEKTPEALVALYKDNPALLRGYVAVVGWHIGSNRTFRPDWKYRPHWKIAWQELAAFFRKEDECKIPLHLRATSYRELVANPVIKAALHRGYATMHHYAERARNIVAEQFTRLVRKRAGKHLYLGISHDDAVQEGRNGLFRAMSRFDYTLFTKQGEPHSFLTYAQWWIDQSIRRAVQEKRGVPVYIQDHISTMNRIERELTHELGTKPSEAVIHEEFLAQTGVSDATLRRVQQARLKMNPISLELTLADDDDRTLLETLTDPSVVAVDDAAIDSEQREKIMELLSQLPERYRDVLLDRYFGNYGSGKTFEAIGNEAGLSRERIRQIEEEAICALKSLLLRKPELRKELQIGISTPEQG